jgi:hypothetical protein
VDLPTILDEFRDGVLNGTIDLSAAIDFVDEAERAVLERRVAVGWATIIRKKPPPKMPPKREAEAPPAEEEDEELF